jgi:hypothetical protein
MNSNSCRQCGTRIKGRIDKKFCDDACRSIYNNRLKSDTALMRNINNVLRKNRKLMHDLIPSEEGKTKTTKKRLEELGFSFSYFTHTYITRTGTVYYFCYEYGYLPLESDYYMLVKRNDD